MNIQEQEARDFDSGHYDRFAGFDRGDTNFDYEEAQRANNEADEEEFRREELAAAAAAGPSELSVAVTYLRNVLAAEWAPPLPCSGVQALRRTQRVHFAQRDFLRAFNRGV